MSEPWVPGEHQLIACQFLLEHSFAGLLLDPGLGKTSVVYASYKVLRKKGLAQRMLVVPPLRPLQLVWPQEQQRWTDFKGIKIYALHGPKKEDVLFDTQGDEPAVFLM